MKTSELYATGIRAARAALNMSQEDLGRLSGTCRPTVNRIESGGATSIKTLDALLLAMPNVKISVSDNEVVIRVVYDA